MTVFQANGDKREESAKREEQNVILSRSSPRAWLTLRPNNLDITVSFGNIPIIVAHGIQVEKKNNNNNNDRNDN